MAAFRVLVLLSFVAVIFGARTGVAVAQSIDVSRSVLTQHNDAQRTGWYRAETRLTPSTVTPTTFGELYRLNVAGMISAQPLYVHGVDIGGVQRNVLYVATNENHIYGFEIKDAGDTRPPQLTPLLTADFPGSNLLPGMLNPWNLNSHDPTPPPGYTCWQTWWKAGITSTPVIDPVTGTMFVVYRTGPKPGPADPSKPYGKAGNYALGAQFWLAALDIRTLKPVQQTVEIKNSNFAGDMELNRPALLLANGRVYVAFGGAVCDYGGNPYVDPADKPKGHGWVFAFDASEISRPPASFITTPTTSLGGIWQSGNGLSALGDSVFAFTGNNGADGDTQNKPEYAQSLIKLNLVRNASGLDVLQPYGWLAPNWFRLDQGDADLASGGPVVFPNNRVVGGGKQGVLYVVDPGSLPLQPKQTFQAFYNTWHPETDVCDYDLSQMNGPNIHGSPVVWHPAGVNYSLFYGMPEKEYLKGFRAYDTGQVDTSPDLTTIESGYRSPDKMPGGFLSISSNGGQDGIVWALVARHYGPNTDATYDTVPGRLLAFDALTLRALWNDDAAPVVHFVKFVPPTIADGKVFRVSYNGEVPRFGPMVGTAAGMVVVYGAKASQGTLPSIPAPTKRVVTAGWDTQAQRLYLFTPAADGEVISTFFRAYPANSGCVNNWRGWFPISDQRPTTGGFPPVTPVWTPGVEHLDLFMVANDGTVKSTFSVNGMWQPGWFGVNPETGKAAPGQPVTAIWRDGKPDHLDLFMTGADGIVRSTYFENGKWQPEWFQASLGTGKAAPGQPITAVWRPGGVGHLDLFMVGSDGTVQSAYFENGKWQSGWFGVPLHPETGKAAPGQPVTAIWRDGKADHLDLFMTGADGIVRSTYFENGKWQPEWFQASLGTGKAAPGQPITAVWRPGGVGHLDLFMVGSDGTVQSAYFENGKWQSGWFGVTTNPGSLKAVPGQNVFALWSSPTHLDLFTNSADGHVRSTFFENGKWQPGWFPL